jgi:hypothetical protein
MAEMVDSVVWTSWTGRDAKKTDEFQGASGTTMLSLLNGSDWIEGIRKRRKSLSELAALVTS